MNRADLIRFSLAVALGAQFFAVGLAAEGNPTAVQPRVQSEGSGERFRVVFEAEWNDIPCTDYPLTPQKWAAECIAPLVNTQVDCLLYNLCSSDGYCCQLNSGELLMDAFDKLPDAWVWRYRENTKRLIEADANPPKLACEYGRRLGLLVIPIVRMNDPHDMFFQYEVSQFKLANPQLLLGSTGADWKPDWVGGFAGLANKQGRNAFTWGMFDYAHQEVRDHKLAIIEEFITRWDNDGVCLDFDRSPQLFKEDGKPEDAAKLTKMLRSIRTVLNRVSKERGRPQYLYVRVIPDFDACHARGMDVSTWVREGLVDVIAPGCGYMTFSLDVKPWLKLVDGSSCKIVVSNNHWKPTEETRAWAKLMLQRGVHGVQLFNFGHLLHGHGPDADPKSNRIALGTAMYNELHPDYYRVLSELGNLRDYSFKNCRYTLESIPHTVTDGEAGLAHRQFRGIDAIALPVSLTNGKYHIAFGFADDLVTARSLGIEPKVTLRALISNAATLASYTVAVNGRALETNVPPTTDGWIECDVPHDYLKLGENELTVTVAELRPGPGPQLDKVELEVVYVDHIPTTTLVRGFAARGIENVELPEPLVVGRHDASFQLPPSERTHLSETDAELLLRLRINNYTYYDDFDVYLNDQLLPADSRKTRAVFIMDNASWVDYAIAASQLQDGANELRFVVRKLNPQMSSTPVVQSIEVMVGR